MKRLVRRAAASLLTRILLVEGVTILAACVLMPLTTRTVLEDSVRAIQSDMLRQQAGLVAGHVTHAGKGLWQIALPRDQAAIYATGYDGRAYALIDARGKVLAHSGFAAPGAWPAAFVDGSQRSFAAGAIVGVSVPLASAQGPLRVVVTQDQERPGAVVDDVVRSFMAHDLLWLVGLLLLMPLANVAMLWPLLRRMRRSARDAANLAPQHPGARLDPRGLPAEALALVEAINDLLGRVDAALALQQEFAGNVAHELRTPLATLRIEAGGLAHGAPRSAMLAQIDRMAHVLAQLRDLAGLEHDASPSLEPLDLADMVIAIVADLTPALLASGHEIAVTGGERPIIVRGNRGLLAMAVTNLLDNARLHTPPGTAIEVVLDARGRLSVIDNGPGITEDDAARLVRRFWRADHRRSDGAGLGLSIVQRIAHGHRGQLLIAPAPGGGASFTLTFPA
jgi:signal transduction histidine kinase